MLLSGIWYKDLGRQTRSIVGDNNAVCGNLDCDHGCDAMLLAIIERIVDKLFNPNYGYASRCWLVSEMEDLPGLKA
jgi:hypothetical protein